jgi:hypothetical protein
MTPYEQELSKIGETVGWAASADIKKLELAVVVVHRLARVSRILEWPQRSLPKARFRPQSVDSSYFTVQDHANPAWFAAAMQMKSTVNWGSD